MVELLINILTHPAFTAVIGFLAGHFFAIGRDRRREFNSAAAVFRSKVLAELEGLYPIPTNWPTEKMIIDRILRDKFLKLQAAVAEFKPFLPKRQQTAFDKAWFIYRMGEDGREIDKQDYAQYIPSITTFSRNGQNVTIDTEKTFQDTFKHNIDNLLKFAEHT